MNTPAASAAFIKCRGQFGQRACPARVKLLTSGLCTKTGSSKFLIYRIDIEEPAVPAAITRWGQAPPPAASPKPIVSAWNPDESWDDDPAVRDTAGIRQCQCSAGAHLNPDVMHR